MHSALRPQLCAVPSFPRPHFSKADDASTHGKKLYSLFAADRNAYLAAFEANAAKPTAAKVPPEVSNLCGVKQVLVKESWTIKEVTEDERTKLEESDAKKPQFAGDHFSRFVSKGDKKFHADAKGQASSSWSNSIRTRKTPTTAGSTAPSPPTASKSPRPAWSSRA